MKRSIDKAIVLRRTNYGERDRVVTLLTKDHGKITVFAKGVRSPKSRLSGGIELLSVSEVGFIDGKSDMKTLTNASLITYYDPIVRDIHKTNSAFEALKRISKLIDDGAGQEYFGVLQIYLESLSNENFDKDLVEIWFGLQLLNTSGVLGTIRVQDSNASSAEDWYRFNYDEQFFECHENGGFSKNDIKLLRLLGSQPKPVRLAGELETCGNLLQFTRTLFTMNLA